MNRNSLKAIVIFLFIAAALILPVQPLLCEPWISWDTSDGLPSNNVLFIAEDEEGIIWLCTDRGLCSFDGTAFHTYGDTTSSGPLRDCRTRCIATGPAGTIWVGTESGLEQFDKTRGHSLPVDVVCKEGYNSPPIKALLTDSDGSLWIHAGNGKIIHYDPDNQQAEFTDFKGAYLEGDYFYDHIFKDSHGRIWTGGRATSIALIENGNIGTCTYPIRNPDTEHFEGSAFAQDNQGNLYATDDKGLLSVYDSTNGTFRTIFNIPIAATCATTDQRGRIWFGGRNGLIRMNGQMNGFDRFRHIPKDNKSLSSNNIYCLCTDHRGNVWAGTDKGLSVYPATNNAITGFATENGLSSDSVTALMQDKDGLLWIGTEENGVDTLNLNTLRCGNLKYELLNGNLPLSTREREKETLRQYALHKAPDDGSLNENKVSALYQDSAGTIYIGLWSHVGFNTYDKKSGTFKRHCLWSVPAGYVFPLLLEGNLWGANWYTGFLEDSRGLMWCTTWEGVGLNLFDREEGEFTGMHFIPGDVPRMPRGTICSHFDDFDNGRIYMAGGKWYGYFDLHTRDFHRYVENFPQGYPNGDILNRYYSHSPARQIDIPVNTLDLRILDKNGDWILLASANSLFEHNVRTDRVNVLHRPEKFRIEYETFTSVKGIHVKWDEETVTAIRHKSGDGFKVSPSPLPEQYFPARDGSRFSLGGDSLFVQTDKGSTIQIESEDRTTDISREAPRTLPSRLASCIAEDKDGFLWYGTTDSGLCRIDITTGEITTFRHEDGFGSGNKDESGRIGDGLMEGLPGNDIRDIFISSTGRIWAGTDKGLCSFDPSGRFITIGTVGTVSVRRVLEDPKGRLWISTDNGLVCLDLAQDTATSFHRCEGLRNEAYSDAATMLADGRIAFGGTYGFDIIDPEALLSQAYPSVILSGLNTTEGSGYQYIPNTIRLNHRNNSFSVDFSSVLAPGLMRRYRLEGFDHEWTYSDNERINIKYTNLPGGSYILHTEILDHSGIWSGRSIGIEVDPPLWLRWWFILTMAAILVLAVVVLIKIRERRLRIENIKLTGLVDQRTEQLKQQIDSKNKFFSILSHDLNNPVRSIDLLSSALVQNWEKMSEEERFKRMKMINSSAKGTTDILDDILTWAMTQTGVMVAQKKTIMLKEAVDAVVESLGGMCDGKNVRIIVEADPTLKVYADPDMLSTILRNLLSNAIKYSYKDSCINIHSDYKNGKALVCIEDHGIGMTTETKEKLFKIDTKMSVRGTGGENGNGLGLITVNEFLKKMDEEITVESTPGKGSTFTFTLTEAGSCQKEDLFKG